jgi:hypothetical protein
MNFLNPTLALVGIACVAIPIAIHLLMRRRRRPVMWAAMRFLLEAYRQQRRRLRLEQLLLLAARCLVIALVALALGRPFFGQAAAFGGRGAMTLYLLIDNGLASTAEDADGTSALERHKAAAASLLGQLDAAAGDRGALIALGGPALPMVLPPTSDTGALRDLVRTLEATESITDIPGGLAAVASEVEGQRGTPRIVIAILSDFLAGSADPERSLVQIAGAAGEPGLLGARGRENILVLASRPAEEGADNVSIVALEPRRPVIIAPRRGGESGAQNAPVSIALQRRGPRSSEAAVSTVRLLLETERGSSTPVGQAAVRWAPGQTEAAASVLLEPSRLGLANLGASGTASLVLRAEIEADAVAGDNTWRRPIEVRRALRVGIVAPRRAGGPTSVGVQQFEPADWVRLALSPMDEGPRSAQPGGLETEIEIAPIEPEALDAARLSGVDAVVIARPDLLQEPTWNRLRGFADAGGLIVVLPPAGAQVHLWPDLMVRELGLNWNIAREARAIEGGAAIATDRRAAGAVGEARDLLELLRPELPELAPPVRIVRILPAEPSAEGGRTGGSLLQLQDGTPLVLASPPGVREGTSEAAAPRGLVVFIATAFTFEWTDLQARPLMVPLMQEVVRQGVGQAIGSRTQLAGSVPHLPARTAELRSTAEGGEVRAIAGGATAMEPIRRAGLWQALDERGAMRGIVAVNADPAGGRTDAQPAQTIQTWLAGALPGGQVQWLEAPQRSGGEGGALHAIFDRSADDALLSLPLLLLALLIAIAEVGMARWFSHATIQPSAMPGA